MRDADPSEPASGPVSRSPVRVRYAETDQMGVVYYANYFVWFEVGRTDLLRTLGGTYRELEAEGISCRSSRRPASTRPPAAMMTSWTSRPGAGCCRRCAWSSATRSTGRTGSSPRGADRARRDQPGRPAAPAAGSFARHSPPSTEPVPPRAGRFIPRSMNALVTGTAGFIGSHLAERCSITAPTVIGIDCFTDYYPRRAEGGQPRHPARPPELPLRRSPPAGRPISARCSTA